MKNDNNNNKNNNKAIKFKILWTFNTIVRVLFIYSDDHAFLMQ
jgi:hypothetical protein